MKSDPDQTLIFTCTIDSINHFKTLRIAWVRVDSVYQGNLPEVVQLNADFPTSVTLSNPSVGQRWLIYGHFERYGFVQVEDSIGTRMFDTIESQAKSGTPSFKSELSWNQQMQLLHDQFGKRTTITSSKTQDQHIQPILLHPANNQFLGLIGISLLAFILIIYFLKKLN